MKLSQKLKKYRTDRPDEWTMDAFTKQALLLESILDRLRSSDEFVDSNSCGNYESWVCEEFKARAEFIKKSLNLAPQQENRT